MPSKEAKEYRRLGGKKMPAEMIIVGGAPIILNYGFRNMTTDIDTILYASSIMKEAINHVEDTMGLYRGWLNEDFKKDRILQSRLNPLFHILQNLREHLKRSNSQGGVSDCDETPF